MPMAWTFLRRIIEAGVGGTVAFGLLALTGASLDWIDGDHVHRGVDFVGFLLAAGMSATVAVFAGALIERRGWRPEIKSTLIVSVVAVGLIWIAILEIHSHASAQVAALTHENALSQAIGSFGAWLEESLNSCWSVVLGCAASGLISGCVASRSCRHRSPAQPTGGPIVA